MNSYGTLMVATPDAVIVTALEMILLVEERVLAKASSTSSPACSSIGKDRTASAQHQKLHQRSADQVIHCAGTPRFTRTARQNENAHQAVTASVQQKAASHLQSPQRRAQGQTLTS